MELRLAIKLENSVRKFPLGRHGLIAERKAEGKIKNKLGFVFLLLLANLSLLLFLRSPFFTIGELSLQGLDKLSTDEVHLALGIREGANIWKISPLELQERISVLPRVDEAEVERVLPDKLLVSIREKYALALIPYHGYYLELAGDGSLIGIRNNYAGELPLINGLPRGQLNVGSNIKEQSRGKIITAFLSALKSVPPPPLAEINVENPEQIIIYTWDGTEVWLGDKKNLSKKIEVLKGIHAHYFPLSVDAAGGHLDLRVAESPVFRPF
ncbi:MAG: FtsQ-type POTRA domain-containing protein [Firmicutes bacterium]|nr:FtsQ-type POTRA domain-containing protein [Bacillota bacterium]